MEILRSHIIKNEHGVYVKLHQCAFGKKGKYFLETTGAYGKVDMRLKPISANKAIAMIEGE